MKVLYLAPPGRSPQQLSRYSFLDEEIRALAKSGIEAFVLSVTADRDEDAGRVHVRAVPADAWRDRPGTAAFLLRHLRTIPPASVTGFYQSYRAIRVERFASEVVRREGIDLVHSYFGWPGGFGGLLARKETGTPLVAGLRGSDINTIPDAGYGGRLNRSYDQAIRRMLRTADATVYVSDFLRRQAEALGARREAGRVLMKGVRLEAFAASADRTALRRELGWGPEPVILAVAGLVKIKGLDHVLQALALVRASGQPFRFVVCGEGPERAALEALAARLGIPDAVTLRGRVARQQMPTCFAAADLFVHGALIEASGNALLEAMASGLPIVCTDAGGPREYVADGECGFVTPVADPETMAARMLSLLRDPELRARFGRAGRRRAETLFAYERMIAQTIETYREVVARSNRLVAGAGPFTDASAVLKDIA